MCKICSLPSHGLCGGIRWPLTRARAALTQQEYALRLPCYAQYFLSSFRRGRCLHRPARETRCVAGHVGPVLHSVALPEPGGQGRPLLQGERIPTPVCALVRNDRVNFWGVIARPVTDVTGLGNPFPPAPRFLCLRRLPFFLRQKKGRKERRQNQGFGILFAAEVSTTSVSSYLADRDVQNLQLAFAWSLRRHPLAAHAGPRCPDAAGKHFASAVMRNISCHRFVGDDAHIVPPYCTPCPHRAG